MKYRLMKFPLVLLLLLYLILLLEKNGFYSKNIQYAYNFYGTDVNVCRGVFSTQSNIYVDLLRKNNNKALL